MLSQLTRFRGITVAVAAVCAAMLVGCGGAPRFQSAYPRSEVEGGAWQVGADREALARAFGERVAQTEEVWVRAGVRVRQPGRRGRMFFTARAMYRAPDHLRFQASRVPLGTLFEVVLRGDEAQVILPREGSTFVGTAEELAERMDAAAGLQPMDMVAAVLSQARLAEALDSPRPMVVRPRGADMVAAATVEEKSGWQIFWLVRRSDGLVREVLIRDEQGREQLRVIYEGYQLEPNAGGSPMPSSFVIHVAGGGEADVQVEEYRVGRALPTKAFEVPEMRQVFPMRSLVFEESP